jgi:hypothetical protein
MKEGPAVSAIEDDEDLVSYFTFAFGAELAEVRLAGGPS